MVLGLILISCGGKEESVDHYPKAIIDAMIENDTETINELCTEEALKDCLQGAKEAQKYTIKMTDLQVLEVLDTAADSKEIEFQFSYTEEKKGEKGSLKEKEQKMFMNLKKIDNKWKIKKLDDTK
jgi:hypothetical protein